MYLQLYSNDSVKVVFVGSERTGKTSLIKRVIGGSWDAMTPSTPRSNLSFWPIQSSRGPVEVLETMPNRDLKSKTSNELSFERSREKPIDHSIWTNWGEVFVFVYSTDSMESYLDSYALVKQWIAYRANRTIQPVGYEETNQSAVTMKLPVLWIGTKSDFSGRSCPPFDQVAATARSLPLKWAEVSARSGDNMDQVRDWIYEAWDTLKARERSIHIHCLTQLSNILSTKHCKGGSLAINIDTLGKCLRHGVLLKVTKRGFKQETPCFLFEKALLFCKIANKGTFSVKKSVHLNMAVLTDSTRPAGDYAFELHAFGKEASNSSSKSHLKETAGAASSSWQLLALGQLDKDGWMDALTFAINQFSRDPERAKHYSSIKGLAVSSRPIQRTSRRQIGLPWSLLSTNLTSGIPIVIDSITSHLNSPNVDTWGSFLLPGNVAEHKTLSERVNRMDLDHLKTNTFLPMPATSGSSPNISSQMSNSPRDTLSSGASSPLSSSGPLSSSPTYSVIGHSVAHASSGTQQSSDKSIDLTGISPLTLAEFLLTFLNAIPTFIPVGFFTFLLQSCQDINMNSATGSQHLKAAFAMLPTNIFKTLARLMFVIQQSVFYSADDTDILKIARYMIPILVKDAVEIESLNASKLLEIVQSLIREADFIFAMPVEGPSTQAPGAVRLNSAGSLGNDSFASSSFGMLSFGSTPTSTHGLLGSSVVNATGTDQEPLSSRTSFSLVSGLSSDRLDDNLSTPNNDSQSSISSLLRGMNESSNDSSSSLTKANTRRFGNFGTLHRALPGVILAGIGPLNTDQVMSRIARARASMAELLDNLKSVEMIITVPEIEAVLQTLVITCNNLSRYKWEQYREVIETDILDELCHLIELFYRTLKTKGTTIEKALKSKATRGVLISLSNDLSTLMNQFNTYVVNLKGHDLAKPMGDRPKPRSGPGSTGSGSSGSFGSLAGSYPCNGAGNGGFGSNGSTDETYSNAPLSGEINFLDELDLSQVSAKKWWNHIFGSHSLRAPTDKVVAELLAVSRSSLSVPLDSSTGGTSLSSSVGGQSGSRAQSPLMISPGLGNDDGSGSQPASPRGGNQDSSASSATSGDTSGQPLGSSGSNRQNSNHSAVKPDFPLLDLSEKEKKALILLLDHQNTGFVNLLKFSQFMKAFGSIPTCVEASIQLIRSPYYRGYLSELEVVRLLEGEEPGTFFLCFEGNDPSNWVIHWIDATQTHKSRQVVASPGEYILKGIKNVNTSRPGLNLNSSSALPSPNLRLNIQDSSSGGVSGQPTPTTSRQVSPRSPPVADPVLSSTDHTPRTTGETASSSDTSGLGTTGVNLEHLASSPSIGDVSSPLLSFDTNDQCPTTPKIEVTGDDGSDSYTSIQAVIEAHPHDWSTPLKTNLYTLPFFYGDISESEGMRALKNQPLGTYLMIFSATKPLTLVCLYISIEERVQHINFERVAPTTARKDMAASPEDSSLLTTEGSNQSLDLLSSLKDGVAVKIESGKTFQNVAEAIKFHATELKQPFTQKKSSGHVSMGSVHEGSLEKLVAYLYDDVVDLAYITVFLLTYRSFTQPPVLLDALTTQYRHLDSLQNGKPYQMRLVNFFKIWLSDFSWDLVNAQDTLANILEFVDSDISKRFPSIVKQLQVSARKIPTEKAEIALHLPFTSPTPSPQTYEEPSKAMDCSPEALAQQMFSFEFELFSKIMPYELMGNGWMKADKNVRAPNIVRMVARSNLIGSWVTAEILKEANVKKRASLIEHFIAVADACYSQNNFHSAMVVMSALHDSSISRLKITWDKVSRKFKEMLEAVELKMSDEDNFALYRSSYNQAPPPKLPYMGLVFRDLIHIEDGSPKHLPSGAINFHRCELIAEKLQMIKMSQQDRLVWPKNEDLWHYIQHFPKHPDEKSQYQRSLELEPRAGGLSQGGSGTGGSSPIGSPSSPRSGSSTDRDEGSSSRRQSRVMVFTAVNPGNNPAGGASATPSPDPTPSLTLNSSSDNIIPPRSVSPNPTGEHSSPSSPDSGKWATPKKSSTKGSSKSSGISAMVGFMRKKG